MSRRNSRKKIPFLCIVIFTTHANKKSNKFKFNNCCLCPAHRLADNGAKTPYIQGVSPPLEINTELYFPCEGRWIPPLFDYSNRRNRK